MRADALVYDPSSSKRRWVARVSGGPKRGVTAMISLSHIEPPSVGCSASRTVWASRRTGLHAGDEADAVRRHAVTVNRSRGREPSRVQARPVARP